MMQHLCICDYLVMSLAVLKELLVFIEDRSSKANLGSYRDIERERGRKGRAFGNYMVTEAYVNLMLVLMIMCCTRGEIMAGLIQHIWTSSEMYTYTHIIME